MPCATLAIRSISTLLRAQRLIRKFDRVLRNVDRIVADALEVGCDFKHRGDLAQLAGDRLLTPDQFDAVRLDTSPQIVNRIVARNNARPGRRVATF